MAASRDSTRFEFGDNWSRFLLAFDDERIAEAEAALRDWLDAPHLRGKTFLDVGSGSGLFSLAARRLGANVRSFDCDPGSVACTSQLRHRFYGEDPNWIVERGDVLDRSWLAMLGRYDVVYSWGVLHHTGDLWRALENVAPLVAESGRLWVAIYNDQGRKSQMWRTVKKAYNALPGYGRMAILIPSLIALWGPATVRDVAMGRPLSTWRSYKRRRGMSPWHDLVDWVGGYPFEVARPEEIFDFFHACGFTLHRLKTCAGYHGCNEFLFLAPGGKDMVPAKVLAPHDGLVREPTRKST